MFTAHAVRLTNLVTQVGATALAEGMHPEVVIEGMIKALVTIDEEMTTQLEDESDDLIAEALPVEDWLRIVRPGFFAYCRLFGLNETRAESALAIALAAVVVMDEVAVVASELIATAIGHAVSQGIVEADVVPKIAGHLMACADVITGGKRRVRHPWAPLLSERYRRFTAGDLLGTQIAPARYNVREDRSTMYQDFVDRMNLLGADFEDANFDTTFRRPIRLPYRPRTSTFEARAVSAIAERDYRIDVRLQAENELIDALGYPHGSDGAWAATHEVQMEAHARYTPVAPPLTLEQETLAVAVAQAMYEEYPLAHSNLQLIRPEDVWAQWVAFGRHKYSPGLPFMGHYRTRRELGNSRWKDVIIDETYRRLREGDFPDMVFHAFVKSQPVKIGKDPRTVTAEAVLSYFCMQVLQKEWTSRQISDYASVGAGRPQTARRLGRVFEQLFAYNNLYTADATKYDSRCGYFPARVVEELAAMGFDYRVPAARSWFSARTQALMNTIIVDLPSGDVVMKNRGGATGHSATSSYNTIGTKGQIIGAWSIYTGRPPREFWRTNRFENTSDDTAWASEDQIEPARFVAILKREFGMEYTLTRHTNRWEMVYTGWVPTPVELVQDELTEFGIDYDLSVTVAADVEMFFVRRSGLVYHKSGMPKDMFLDYMVKRDLGHVLRTPHRPELYTMVAESYMTRVRQFVGEHLTWRVVISDSGHIREVSPSTKGVSETGRKRLDRLLKIGGFPTYEKVLRMHYREVPEDVMGRSKYRPLAWSTPGEFAVRYGLQRVSAALLSPFAKAIAQLNSEPDVTPITGLFSLTNFAVERFALKTMLAENDGVPAESAFHSRLRESVLYSATAGVAFWDLMGRPGAIEELRRAHMAAIRGRVIIACGLFILIQWALTVLRNLSVVGLVVQLYMFWIGDMNVLFAAAGTAFWLSTAAASSVISTLAPKDPYSGNKKVAVLLADLVPEWPCWVIGKVWPSKVFITLTELVSAARALLRFRKLRDGGGPMRANIFAPVAEEAWAQATTWNGAGTVIDSDVSTGKSVALTAAILEQHRRTTVWLAVPTLILRDEYENPLWPGVIDRLGHRRPTGESRLKVCTYGHLTARIMAGSGPSRGDVILADEFGQEKPEMGILMAHFPPGVGLLLLSATPAMRYTTNPGWIRTGFKRRAAIVEHLWRKVEVKDLVTAALESGFRMKRALVCAPSIPLTAELAAGMNKSRLLATAVHRDQRRIPKEGNVVATPIVDFGLNASPPFEELVDSGLHTAAHRGRTVTLPTSPSVNRQRLGRIARLIDGRAIQNPRAGTGPEVVEYPSWSRLFGSVQTRAWMEARLGISNRLRPLYSGGVDTFARHRSDITSAELPSYSLLYTLTCEARDRRIAEQVYESIRANGYPEHYSGVEARMQMHFGTPVLIRVAELRLDTPTFTVEVDGTETGVYGLRYLDAEVQPIL